MLLNIKFTSFDRCLCPPWCSRWKEARLANKERRKIKLVIKKIAIGRRKKCFHHSSRAILKTLRRMASTPSLLKMEVQQRLQLIDLEYKVHIGH